MKEVKTAVEANELFKDHFLPGEGDIRPESLVKAFEKFDITIKSSTVKTYTAEEIVEEIDSLTKSYTDLAEDYERAEKSKVISAEMSKLVLANTHIYDEEMCNFVTDDMDNSSKSPISSRFTYIAARALECFAKQWIETEQEDGTHRIDPALNEAIGSLFYTAIELFDPQVVANVLAVVIKVNKANPYLTRSRIRGYYETLRNKEMTVYANEYCEYRETVGFAYINAMGITAEEIVFDEYELVDFFNETTLPVYKRLKSEFSKTVVAYICNTSPENASKLLIKMREDITSWIKVDDLTKRSELPITVKTIDIKEFTHKLYNDMIHVLGDEAAIVDTLDERIEACENKLDDTNLKEEEKTAIEADKKRCEERRLSYLTLKSAVDFYFLELSSNEEAANLTLSKEFIVELLIKELPLTFGMSHPQFALAAMYAKRDFTPMDHKSINPYYTHYTEVFPEITNPKDSIDEPTDIASNTAYYFASAIAANVHVGMRSITALTGAYDFKRFESTLASLNDSLIRTRRIAGEIIVGYGRRLDGLAKQYKSLSNDVINDIVGRLYNATTDKDLFSIENINLISDAASRLDVAIGELTEKGYELSVSMNSCIRDLIAIIEWYKSRVNSAINIMKQAQEIFINLDSIECKNGGLMSKNEEKPMYNFWPVITQYQYEIEEEDPSGMISDNDTSEPLKPGDVRHHRYGSRYTLTEIDD